MAASDSLRIDAQVVRTLAFGSVGPTFSPVGTVAGDSIRMLQINNLTNQTLMFSQYGTIDNFPLAANGYFILDVTTNRTNVAQGAYLDANTRIHCRHLGVAPTSGTVYVTYWVAANN